MTTILESTLADHYGHMDGADGWMWLWGMIMMLAFVALIALGIWAVLRSQSRVSSEGTPETDATASARAILAERFARGEISPEEYREKLDHLRA